MSTVTLIATLQIMRFKKTAKRAATLLTTLFLAPVAIPAQKPSGCLPYEPVVVELKGTIIRRTFPGPPNYESVKRGDRPEVVWLLILREPICMQEDKNDPGINIAQTDIREIQIVFSEADGYKKYQSFVGTAKTVIVTGTLFGSHTGHHHTRVLITAKTLAAD